MLGLTQAQYSMAASTLDAQAEEDSFHVTDILKFAADTIVDIGVTAINSVTFGAFDLDTKNVLDGLGAGMGLGDYYAKHQEGINLTSFVGGMIVPGMAASKALKWARGASTPFGAMEASKLAWKAEALEQTRLAGATNEAVKSAIKSARLWTLGEGVAEGMVYEASFGLFMNKHAYMDNNYGLDDAVLGVALGSLVGPMRLLGLNKDIRSGIQQISSKQMEKVLLPASHAALRDDQQLAMLGSRMQEMKTVDLSSLAATNIDIPNLQRQANNFYLKEVAAKVKSMGTPEFNSVSWNLADKTGGTKLLGDIAEEGKVGDYWAFNSPADVVINHAIANPKGMLGTKKFGIFDPDSIGEALVKDIEIDDLGNRIIPTASQARNLYFYAQSAKKVVAKGFELRKSMPEGIKVDESYGEVFFSADRKLGQSDRQWIADYLSIPYIANKKVKFSPMIGKLVADTKAIKSEVALQNLELFGNKATPWQEALELVNTNTPGVVIHPHANGHMFSTAEAASAQVAAMNPTINLAKGATLREAGNLEPFTLGSAQVDAKYLRAMAAVNKEAVRKGTVIGEDQMHVVQALYSKALRNQGKWTEVLVGQGENATILKSVEAAGDYLLAQKTKLLSEGLDKGFSQLQLSVNLNIPFDAIEEFVANGRNFVTGSKHGIITYKDINRVSEYAGAKAIHLHGESAVGKAMEETRIAGELDEVTRMAIHDDAVTTILNTTHSRGGELAEMGTEVFQSGPMRELMNNLPKLITTFDSQNILFNSTDHVLRKLGPLGDHVTTLANNFNKIMNKHVERYKKELTASMASIASHDASGTQFARLRQAVHGKSIEEAKNFVFDSNRGVIVTRMADEASGVTEQLLTYHNTDEVIKMTPQVNSFMQAYMPVMNEMLSLRNAATQLSKGGKKTAGAGVWFPYDPINKEFVGYKISKANHNDVELIVANSAEDLKSLSDEFLLTHGKEYEIVTRANAEEYWNQINRYAELEQLKRADLSQTKHGYTASNVVPGGYEIRRFTDSLINDTRTAYRQIFRSANAPLFDQLDFAARQASSYARSSAGNLAQKVQRKTSMPELISSTLLSTSLMGNVPLMDMANNMTAVALNTAINNSARLWKEFKANVGDVLHGKKAEEGFIRHAKELEEAKIPNPYKDASDYMNALKRGNKLDIAQHKIAAAQSILVTANLRFCEAAHAMVTISSIPVIMAGELKSLKYPMKNMIDAVKFMQGKSVHGIPEDVAKKVMTYGSDMGYTKAVVAETTELLADLHTDVDFLTKHKGIIDLMSKPSDLAEGYARSYSYALGYIIAKQRWPEASNKLLISHAAAFTNRTMGNYASKQKPALFQGAFGSMVGLYQTFMLTMGQNLYRYAEAGDKAAIGALLGSQAGMFGMEALPGFQSFNQLIGEYVSDEHSDVRSVAYRVFGNSDEKSVARAEFVLFGLPSTLFGSALYTRGQLAPRGPFDFTSKEGVAFKPAIFDAAIQAYNSTFELANSLAAVGKSGGSIGDFKDAALQGVAAQNLWRPGARLAELALGRSFDMKGELISSIEEVREPSAIISRLLATRPLREQAMRNLKYQTSYYEGVDQAARSKIIKQIRRIASSGEDMSNIDELYSQYMENGGSYNSWEQAMKSAYQASGTQYSERISEYAKKNPAIVEIAEMYSN